MFALRNEDPQFVLFCCFFEQLNFQPLQHPPTSSQSILDISPYKQHFLSPHQFQDQVIVLTYMYIRCFVRVISLYIRSCL